MFNLCKDCYNPIYKKIVQGIGQYIWILFSNI